MTWGDYLEEGCLRDCQIKYKTMYILSAKTEKYVPLQIRKGTIAIKFYRVCNVLSFITLSTLNQCVCTKTITQCSRSNNL